MLHEQETPRAFGNFRKVNDYLFRTDTYLQWGDSTDPLGLVVMLNPGSSRLLDSDEWQSLESGTLTKACGELVLDNTMK